VAKIAMTPVDSTVIEAIGYERTTQTLALAFHHGATYHYAKVPPAVYEGLQVARSKGGYFREVIRGKYVTTKQGEVERA